MNRISTALAAASLLALGACGGAGEDAAANNALTTTEVPADELTLPPEDNLTVTDANAIGTDELNAADANLAVDANASGNVTNSY